jgi:HlyD family secretion protein
MAVMGTMNNPGSLLLTIADPSVMEARVRVDEADVPRISAGDSATVSIDAFPGRPFAGRVEQIANSALAVPYGPPAEQQSSRYEVVITLAGGRGELRPDLSASAEIVVASRKKALAAPILALTLRDAPAGAGARARGGAPSARKARREGVFVVRDGRARFVPVQSGIAGDQYFEVKSGLGEGEVVVSGSYETVRQLVDGALVRVAAPAAQPGGR